MKKQSLHKILAGIFVACMAYVTSPDSFAQYLLDQTYMNPIHVPKVTTQYVTNATVDAQTTFTGTIHYHDGIIARYDGQLKFADGSYSSCSNYTPQFGVPEGGYFIFVDANHENAYQIRIVNGQKVPQNTYNIKGRSFTVSGASLTFVDGNSGYSGGSNYNYDSSSSSSSSSSDYDRHKATCQGCHGTGLCQRCGGTGKRQSTYGAIENCSLCHGTGRCQSCHGKGFIRGNF